VRDAGRCRFVAADGRRCSERRFIQFHHNRKPYALGGEATAEDMELRLTTDTNGRPTSDATVAGTCQARHKWPRGQFPEALVERKLGGRRRAY
jgi:hypothetical protein